MARNALGSIAVRTAAKRARYEVAQQVLALLDSPVGTHLEVMRNVREYCAQFEPVASPKKKA